MVPSLYNSVSAFHLSISLFVHSCQQIWWNMTQTVFGNAFLKISNSLNKTSNTIYVFSILNWSHLTFIIDQEGIYIF